MITKSIIIYTLLVIASYCASFQLKANDMPLTQEQLKKLCPNAKPGWVESAIKAPYEEFDIQGTLRYNHFMAQILHETGGLYYITEAGSHAYCSKYDGRKDLGNIYPGDGCRFKGRGPIQLTGRHSYKVFGKKLGIDLENNPELVATPEVGWKVAMLYWKDRNLNKYADQDDIRTITKRINGGYNGFEDRKRWYEKVSRLNKN